MPLADPAARRDPPWAAWAVAGFLVVMIGIIYGQTLWFGFLAHDDMSFVNGNPLVSPGLSVAGIAAAFVSGPMGQWHPLSMISHMLDCQIFGLNAWGHHLTNLILHAATSIGLFLVLRSMTGELWPSAVVATLLAVHPQHVESVAWIAERRDVLSGLFFVLTLAAYLGYVRQGCTLGRYLLVALVFTLGLMSKATLVTVPPLLLLLDYWPLGRWGRAAVTTGPAERKSFWWLAVEKLPLLALSVGDCVADGGHAERRRYGRAAGFDPAAGHCGGGTGGVFAAGVLSGRPGRFLSGSGRRLSGLEDRLFDRTARRDHGCRRGLAARLSLFVGRLVLVYGHAGSHAGIAHDRGSRDGRSLHVSAPDRAEHRRRVGCHAAGGRIGRVGAFRLSVARCWRSSPWLPARWCRRRIGVTI